MTDAEKPLEGVVSEVKPWAVKAMPVETSQAIIDAARAERMTVAEWLTKRMREWTANGQAVAVVAKAPADDLANLIRLAREATPEGKDSGAMQEARRVVLERLKPLRAGAREQEAPRRLNGPVQTP